MQSSLTSELVELAVGLSIDDVPEAALDLVELAFIDTIGCVLAGSTSDEARLAARWASAMEGRGEATVLGVRDERLPVALAGLVNATAGHALDLDDVSPYMTHPSTCLVPPLLALAERTGASGDELTMAYVAGFEVCVRLCRIVNPEHYYRGWHSMGTVNGLGVAAGAARLLGLDATATATAIGIAAASAAGIRKNFGTMVKPLHAGQTAFRGVQAAELAAAGFTADLAVLDGQHGFFDVFADADAVAATTTAALDRGHLELVESGIIFKQYACCGALHPGIDVVRELTERHGIAAGDIASIHCAVNSRAPQVLVHHQATTGAEGRFSVEYSLAVAAIDRDAGPAQYTAERVADPVVQHLSRAVEVVVDDDLPTGYALFPTIVTITTTDGATYTERRDLAHGDPHDPLGADDVLDKFRRCAAFVLDQDGVERTVSAVQSLRHAADVRAAIAALAG